MKLKSLLLAMGLACAATANAVTAELPEVNHFDLGDIVGRVLAPSVVTHHAGLFEDYFFFHLGAAAFASGLTRDIEADVLGTMLYDIEAATFTTSFFHDVGQVGVSDDADYGSVLGVGDAVVTRGPLLAGDYYVKVSGRAVGTWGGAYTALATAVPLPVPEPESYAMLIAGLGLIGGVARRRNRK